MLAGHGVDVPCLSLGSSLPQTPGCCFSRRPHSVTQAAGGHELKPGIEQEHLFYILF